MEMTPVEATQKWVEKVVVGLNLCPFAAPVVRNGQLKIEVSDAKGAELLMEELMEWIEILRNTPVEEVNTMLIIHPAALRDFEEYLDFLAAAEEILEESGWEEDFQIASFHPDYCFADAPFDDPANFTNRSPYPMLHILRQDVLTDALEHFPNPEGVPEKNVELLRGMGMQKILALLEGMNHPAVG